MSLFTRALDDLEVTRLFEGREPQTCPGLRQGLVIEWLFEGEDEVVVDTSGLGHDALLNNGTREIDAERGPVVHPKTKTEIKTPPVYMKEPLNGMTTGGPFAVNFFLKPHVTANFNQVHAVGTQLGGRGQTSNAAGVVEIGALSCSFEPFCGVWWIHCWNVWMCAARWRPLG